jgi:hypothetical protein
MGWLGWLRFAGLVLRLAKVVIKASCKVGLEGGGICSAEVCGSYCPTRVYFAQRRREPKRTQFFDPLATSS